MDDCLLYVGTENGVRAYELRGGGADGGETTKVGDGVRGNAVRQISVHPDDPREALVGCGLRGWGLHRTRNAGDSWDSLGFEEAWVWGVERDPTDPDTVYVGTEPPMLYRSRDGVSLNEVRASETAKPSRDLERSSIFGRRGSSDERSEFDGGESFSSFDAITDLPTSDRWTFFYEPFNAGHVHGITIDPENPERVFAGVEHGGFVFTHDGGDTWDDSLAGYDVHDSAVVPGTDRVFVAAGEGLLVSDDIGEEFEAVVGFEDDYVQQFLEVGDRLYVDASAGSDSDDATIAYTDDDGDSWHHFEGVPAVSVTGCRLLAAYGDTLFHAQDDGESEVVATDDEGDTWVPVGPTHGKVRAIAAAPLP